MRAIFQDLAQALPDKLEKKSKRKRKTKMSTFEVKVRTIDILEPHPNADRLELVIIGGYKAVVQKGIHKVGDLILYVPEDTIFTDLSVTDKLQCYSYLTGEGKNRVKAIRLRGVLSQGIVLPLSAFDNFITDGEQWCPAVIIDENTKEYGVSSSEDIISILKLEKYEEEIPEELTGQIRPWPSFIPGYYIENIKRPESMTAIKNGEEVIVTEKLHGKNMTVAFGPGLNDDEKAFVCSSNRALIESESNVYWRAALKYHLITKLNVIFHELIMLYPIKSISIHGEVVGIQDLKYGYNGDNIGFYAFDFAIDGEFVNYAEFVDLCTHAAIPMVPVLYTGPYDYDTVNKLTVGKTTIGQHHIIEGVVVKPVEERRDLFAGRIAFKFISEDYLLRKGGTEFK